MGECIIAGALLLWEHCMTVGALYYYEGLVYHGDTVLMRNYYCGTLYYCGALFYCRSHYREFAVLPWGHCITMGSLYFYEVLYHCGTTVYCDAVATL